MPDPMYKRIAEQLRGQIEAGQLPSGSQLPTELELRERYDASRNTVRDAIKWLVARGLVETRPGQGTFVVKKLNPFITTLSADPETALGGGEGGAYLREVTAGGREPTETKPRVEIHQATGAIATQLGVAEGTAVVSRHQERYIDKLPYSLQTSFYPMRLVNSGAHRLIEAVDIESGTVSYLSDVLGIKQVGYRDLITVRAPDSNETTFFKLPDDGRISVYETFRIAFDAEGLPFRLTVSVFPADRNQFVVNVGLVPDEHAQPAR